VSVLSGREFAEGREGNLVVGIDLAGRGGAEFLAEFRFGRFGRGNSSVFMERGIA